MSSKTATRLAILIAVLGLVGGLGFFAQRVQIARMAQSVSEQAKNAEDNKEFARAEMLLKEHLEVKNDDLDVQRRYADVIVKSSKLQERRVQAVGIYFKILQKDPGNTDVRRRLAEELFGLRDSNKDVAEMAVAELKILLEPTKAPGYKPTPADGHLEFLMGQCQEKAGSEPGSEKLFESAVEYYQKAIDHAGLGPERLEAYSRQANLLRNRQQDEEGADEVIDAMVDSDPENYRAYLYRGRYLKPTDLPEAKKDLLKALQLAPGEIEVYLELASVVEKESGTDAAEKVLKEGLERERKSAALYEALALLDCRARRYDKAVEQLEGGLKLIEGGGIEDAPKVLPGVWQMRRILADIAIERRDSVKLDQQIEKLQDIGFPPIFLRLMKAQSNILKSKFNEAVQILGPLRSDVADTPQLRAQVNLLLANCYASLGDPDAQRDALSQATNANPGNVNATLAQAEFMVRSGDINGAILKYQGLAGKQAGLQIPLARLLLLRNEGQPPSKRDWIDFNRVIADASKNGADPSDLTVLKAQSLLLQDKAKEADAILTKAFSEQPKSMGIRLLKSRLMESLGQVDDALKLIEESRQQLGDHVDLRLERARLLGIQKGPQLETELNKLEQKMEQYSKEDRLKLLDGLAKEHIRQKDYQGTGRLWSEMAQLAPRNLDLRFKLADLAFQTANKSEIEKQIQQIEAIEGKGGRVGTVCQARYLLWQAQPAKENDKDQRAALRTAAGAILNGLSDRQKDWSLVPVFQAELWEQELAESGLDEAQKLEKTDALISSYLSAIGKGDRNPRVVNRVVALLRNAGRVNEALEIINQVSGQTVLVGDTARIAALLALRSGDFSRAEAIARKAMAANPGDLQERVLLAQILQAGGHQTDADTQFRQVETELRKNITVSKDNSDLWGALVKLMVDTKQPDKAEKDLRDAQANLTKQPDASFALAQLSEMIGRSYAVGKNNSLMNKWYLEAKSWYEKAHDVQPDNLLIARRMVEFFIQTKQTGEAESHLEAMIKRSPSTKSADVTAKLPDTASWARRSLAVLLADKGREEDIVRAQALLERTDQTGEGRKPSEDPDDQRLLARVLARQKTPETRRRAIGILEKLIAKAPDNTEDRFLLAQLEDITGDWPEAQKQYKEVIARAKNRQNLAKMIPEFVNRLIEHHEDGERQDLTEAQELIDQLARIRPDELDPLTLEVKLNRVQNQIANATTLIKQYVDRPRLPASMMGSLAGLAEGLVQDIPPVVFTGSLTNGTSSVTGISNMTGLVVGQTVTGPDIAARTTILTVDSPTAITLSAPATASGSRSLAAVDPAVQGAMDLAEQIHQRAAKADGLPGILGQVGYLGRRGRVKEALDICEPLWQNAREPLQVNALSVAIIRVVLNSNSTVEPVQIKRAVDWFNQALIQNPRLTGLVTMLGNLKENQGNYSEAEGLYRRAIEQGDEQGISCNNLAWLLALKDGKAKEALEYVNRAINRIGPRSDFLDTRGVIYMMIPGEIQSAITDLKSALAGDPSPAKYFHLAQAYLKAGKLEEAKSNMKAAKIKGWRQSGLHELEQDACEKLRRQLGMQ